MFVADLAIMMEECIAITSTTDFEISAEDDGHLECDHENNVFHCDAA